MSLYRYLADLVVTLHLAYVAFVVFGLLLILLGIMLRWGWVRGFWFRIIHFLMIAVVVLESALGIDCPLTILENRLREWAGEEVEQGTFIGRMAHNLLIYDRDSWQSTFEVIYSLFAVAVFLTLILAPPRWPRWLKVRRKSAAKG